MSIYTVEIDGLAIAVFSAEDKEAAEDFVHDEEFRGDLLSYDTETGPLWDGSDPIVTRPALPEELKKYQESLAEALAEGHDGGEREDLLVIFLVPVIDPEDDDDAANDDDEK